MLPVDRGVSSGRAQRGYTRCDVHHRSFQMPNFTKFVLPIFLYVYARRNALKDTSVDYLIRHILKLFLLQMKTFLVYKIS